MGTRTQQLAALSGARPAHYALSKPVDIDELERPLQNALTEYGMAEVVPWVQALEKMDKVDGDEPDRRYTERLARQHAMLQSLRHSGEAPPTSVTSPTPAASPARPSSATSKN